MISIEQIINASKGLLDFHTHSTHSDGTRTPTQLVYDAKKACVSALALTDHNIISGLDEFNHACKKDGILPIPFGTEIHAELPGYLISPGDNYAPDLIILGKNPIVAPFRYYQDLVLKDWIGRVLPTTVDKLRGLGYTITQKEYDEQINDLKKNGLQMPPRLILDFINKRNNLEIFDRYLSEINAHDDKGNLEIATKEKARRQICKYLYATNQPVFIQRISGFNVEDAIKLTEEMNCKLFVAHPGGEYGPLGNKVLRYYSLNELGIEVRSYSNNDLQNKNFDNIALAYGLTRSGGSDYHGPDAKFKLGMHDKKENQLDKRILKELWESLP